MELVNTSAIVTGGASGLGAAAAHALAARGVAVFALDLERAVTGARPHPGIRYLSCDVTSPEDVGRAVDAAQRGGIPLRIVVNCAGIGPSARILGRSGPHDLALFERVVRINLCGTFNVLATAAAVIAEIATVKEQFATGQGHLVEGEAPAKALGDEDVDSEQIVVKKG